MNGMVPIALFGWPVAALVLFATLPARVAVMSAYIGAWLFLPIAGYRVTGFPDYDKTFAATLGAAFGAALFDSGRLLAFRPSLLDVPMLVWCTSPFVTSVLNGLGPYDGMSAVVDQCIGWGIPYYLGRVYFPDAASLRVLAVGIFVGGLIYVPLCLLEMRMSPQLHRWIYGFHPAKFHMTWRLGGYRPVVFMQHGIMLGLWMTLTTTVGLWLWGSGTLRGLFGVRTAWLAGGLTVVTIFCRSMGALVLLAFGIASLLAMRTFRTRLVAVVLIAAPALYIGAAVSGPKAALDERMVSFAERLDADRALSLAGRLRMEGLLTDKALQRPFFGWGRWNRNRTTTESGDRTVTDGFWIITFGQTGFVGLVAVFAAMLTPVALVLWRLPASALTGPMPGAVGALAILVALYAIDSLLNAMFIPIVVVAVGGLTAWCVRRPVAVAARQQAAPRRLVPPAAPHRRPGFEGA